MLVLREFPTPQRYVTGRSVFTHTHTQATPRVRTSTPGWVSRELYAPERLPDVPRERFGFELRRVLSSVSELVWHGHREGSMVYLSWTANNTYHKDSGLSITQ